MAIILRCISSLLFIDIRIDVEIQCAGGKDDDIVAGAQLLGDFWRFFEKVNLTY